MNNPDDFPVDEDELRAWINERRSRTGISWKGIADESGIAQGTISTWATGAYAGNGQNIAKKVFKYRQLLASREDQAADEQAAGLSNGPGHVETKTGRRLKGLMIRAHTGSKMTYAATGSGLGKTEEALDYCACVARAYMITLDPVTKSPTAVMEETLRALGASGGTSWARQMSAQIMNLVRGKRCLLIVDEANYASFETLELFRAWNERAGLGICMLGNEELHKTIRTGAGLSKKDSIARLNRRISQGHLQDMSLDEDIEAYLDAWKIEDAEGRALLKRVGATPGTGGLGEIKEIIENAALLAFEDGQALTHGHLREAMASRATSYLRTRS